MYKKFILILIFLLPLFFIGSVEASHICIPDEPVYYDFTIEEPYGGDSVACDAIDVHLDLDISTCFNVPSVSYSAQYEGEGFSSGQFPNCLHDENAPDELSCDNNPLDSDVYFSVPREMVKKYGSGNKTIRIDIEANDSCGIQNFTRSVGVDVGVCSPAPSCSLSANPNQIFSGESSVLKPSYEGDVEELSINMGIGDVSLNDTGVSVSPTETTTYTMTAEGPGGEAMCSTEVAVLPPQPKSDVSVTTSVTPKSAKVGDVITYTINYNNFGLGDAKNTRVVTASSPSASLINYNIIQQPNQGSCSVRGSGVSCNLGTLSAGLSTASSFLNFPFILIANAQNFAPQQFIFSATANTTGKIELSSLINTTTIESNTSNNQHGVEIEVDPPIQLPNLWPESISSGTILKSNSSTSTENILPDGSSGIFVDDRVNFVAKVKNIGQKDMNSSFSVEWFVDGVQIGERQLATGLEKGGSIDITSPVWVAVGEGEHSIKISVDKTRVIEESNEGDNELVKVINVFDSEKVDPPTCDSFTANPSTTASGGSSTLSWDTSNASKVTLDNGFGEVSVNGSQVVNPTADITYTLTVDGPNDSTSCSTSIVVDDDTGGGGGGGGSPNCTLSANPLTISGGESSSITFTTENTSAISVNNGVGSLSLNDSPFSVSPNETTTYTMTVSTSGKSNGFCQATITVGGSGDGGGPGSTQCSDEDDNDEDGWTDADDPGCIVGGVYDPEDDNETNDEDTTVNQCSDGIDNDGDGLFDAQDPDCKTGIDPTEGPVLFEEF